MWAMIVKEFRQLRRDRRTLAMMIVLPVLLLVVLGYAASFNVSSIPVAVAGPQSAGLASALPAVRCGSGCSFALVSSDPGAGRGWAEDQLRGGPAAGGAPIVLIDGSQIFTAQATLAALAKLHVAATGRALARPRVTILYNPKLR